jgi:hypothetical protein
LKGEENIEVTLLRKTMSELKLGAEIWIMRDDKPRLVVIVEEEIINSLDIRNDADAFHNAKGNYLSRTEDSCCKYKVRDIELRNDFKYVTDHKCIFYPSDPWGRTKEELLAKL